MAEWASAEAELAIIKASVQGMIDRSQLEVTDGSDPLIPASDLVRLLSSGGEEALEREWDDAHDAFCQHHKACSMHGQPGDRRKLYGPG